MHLNTMFSKALRRVTDGLDTTDAAKATWMQSHVFHEAGKNAGQNECVMAIAKLQPDGTWTAKVLHGTDLKIMHTSPADLLGEKLDIKQAIGLLEKFDTDHAGQRRRHEFFVNVPYAQKIEKALNRPH